MRRYLWLAFALVLAGAVIGYRELSSGVGRKPEGRSGVAREVSVKLAAAKRAPIAYTLNTSGDVLPLMQVDVVSRIAGYIDSIHFEIGDRVGTGQVVAVVEPKDLHHRVEEDEAALRVADANLREKEALLRHAERQLGRSQTLREKDFISTQDLDEAENRVNTARAQRELALAQLAQRGAALAQSRYQLSMARVVAPFAGVVTRRLVDPGAHVTSSTPILTLAVPDPLKVAVNIPERDVNLIRVGMPAKLVMEAFPGRAFGGRIARLNSALDATSRTLMAEIHVPNPRGELMPGMFARVSLILAEDKNSLVVPAEAVLEDEGKEFVFTVDQGKAVKRPVTRGWSQNEMVAVSRGLEEGDRIVVAGQHRLKDGMKVRVLEEAVRGEQ